MDLKASHYKLLGVETNASADAIRQAYKKKALEWHPDKRGNDIYAEQMFKEIKKAYETLSNSLTRLEYDVKREDEDDDTISLDVFCLSTGKSPSKIYEEKLAAWADEYSDQSFIDNVDTVMDSISKTILDKYHNNFNIDTLPSTVCSVCGEQCYDLNEHFISKQESYIMSLEIMRKSNSSLNDQLSVLAPDDWSWKPVDAPALIFQQLWTSTKWTDLPHLLNDFTPVLSILIDPIPCNINTNSEIEKNVRIFCNIGLVHYMPHITPLITAINNENSVKTPGTDCTIDEDNKRRMPTGSSLSIVDNTDARSSLGQLCYDVKAPSLTMTANSRCSSCKKSLSIFLFRRRCYCRMCGQTQCQDCRIWQTCRHLGYTWPVPICQACASKKTEIIIDVIRSNIQRSVMNRSSQYLSIYIGLLNHYSLEEDAVYKSVEKYSLLSHNFACVMQCFTYRSAPCEAWFTLAEKACSAGAFECAFTCFNVISMQFQYKADQWSKIGSDYCEKGNVPLALFSYRQANIGYEQVWLKCVLKLDTVLIARYTTSQAVQVNNLNAWIKSLTSYLTDENLGTSAIMTLQLAELNASQWAPILEGLVSNRQFTTFTKLLKTIPKSSLHEIMSKSANPTVRLVCLSFNDPTKVLDYCFTHLLTNIENLLVGLVIGHVLQQPDWKVLQKQYFDLHEFDKMLICYKFRNSLHLCSDDDLGWIDAALSANESFGYLMKSLTTKRTYIQLAEAYAAESSQFEIALNYYILQLNKSLTPSNTHLIIKSTMIHLPTSQALRCHLAIYKLLKSNSTLVPIILETICNDLKKANKPFLDILIECILILEEMNVLEVSFHCRLLNELAKHFDENLEIIDAAFHFLSNIDLSTQEAYMHDLAERYRKSIIYNGYAKLKEAVYMDIVQLAHALSQATNVDVLEKIYRECFDNRKMNSVRGDYRAKMYLVEGLISKLKGQFLDAVGKFHQAMLCAPFDDTASALIILMNDFTFQQALVNDLILSISKLSISSVNSTLTATIQPPPSEFATENCLAANIRLNLIRKYERAILKRLTEDPLQAAFSYIDMCQAIHDPTCLVSNWTIASMYVFESLKAANSSEGQEAHVYAYRNLIEELACQSFVISRHFLPPHMQVYIFRLLFTLLVETNKIFRSSVVRRRSRSRNAVLIISDRQSQVVTQLLNFIVHLTIVSPFIQLPTSLTYDVMYLELVGQHLLVNFLESMAEHSHLYVYYLFEGVWEGWARNKNFTEMRLKCMEVLLATKGWDLFDVQLLLDIPLIPRTADGWLYQERQQLAFASAQRFSKVDGISFDVASGEVQFLFEPVTMKHADAMFDSNDVVEVFQRGLTGCLFTLNQPDNDFHTHPFQEMLYHPSSLLYTQYCATLLHTDYLLKMFTTGTEVASKPPFEMRAISEGFFQRLPAHLQEKLKPLHDRERNLNLGRAHRFWIEADDVVYERTLVGTKILYRVADVRLRVRKHLLIRNLEGKLVDDEEANENEEEKRSAESQFAKAFTDHYDEIGTYFPELLRLKELLKISALYVFARSRYENLKEPRDYYPIKTNLVEMRREIDYPRATASQVDEYYNDALSKSGISSWDVPAGEERSARSMIRSQLEEVDRKIIDKVVENLCEQAHTSVSNTAQSFVKAWLDNQCDGAEQLARFIADCLNARDYALMRPIEKLGIRIRANDDKYEAMKHADNTCNWVPAVFLNKTDNGMRIYGGVNLQLILTGGEVSKNNRASGYSAANIFASQTNSSATGPRNKQEYHEMKQKLTLSSTRNSGSSQRDSTSPAASGGSGSSGNGGSSGGGKGGSSGGGNGRKSPYDPSKSGTEKKTESFYAGPKPKYDKSHEDRHKPGHRSYGGPSKTPIPEDAERVYNSGAISGDATGKTWYARAEDGKTIYRYQGGHDGSDIHFNASTKTGLRLHNIPNSVKKELGVKG